MTATIIQSNSAPFNEVEVDGVTVDIIENALRNARIAEPVSVHQSIRAPCAGIRVWRLAVPCGVDRGIGISSESSSSRRRALPDSCV